MREAGHNPGAQDERRKIMNDYLASAAALYDGGWRAEDKDQIVEEYELTEEEADKLFEILEELEKDAE